MRKFTLPSIFAFGLWLTTPVAAQIGDNSDSYSLLAVHCAKSASESLGVSVSPAQYEEYSKKLAKTLSLLTAEQQERVFGNYSGGSTSEASSEPEEASGMDNFFAGLGQNIQEMEEKMKSGGSSPSEPIIAGPEPGAGSAGGSGALDTSSGASGEGTLHYAPGFGPTSPGGGSFGEGKKDSKGSLNWWEQLIQDVSDAVDSAATAIGDLFKKGSGSKLNKGSSKGSSEKKSSDKGSSEKKSSYKGSSDKGSSGKGSSGKSVGGLGLFSNLFK